MIKIIQHYYCGEKSFFRAEETVLPSAKRRRLDPTFLRMLETYPGMYRPSEIERNQINVSFITYIDVKN